MPDYPILSVDDIVPDRRRGGDIRTLLSPRSVGSTSGFTGIATIAPGERIAEHYHPFSEEFLYVVSGEISAELDDTPHPCALDKARYDQRRPAGGSMTEAPFIHDDLEKAIGYANHRLLSVEVI